MSGSYNRVVVQGNVTRDPELKLTAGKTYVTELGIAVNERFKDKDGRFVDKPVFVDVTLWAKTAEIACEMLRNGSGVLIEGRLTMDTWEKDGRKQQKLKVTGEKLFLSGKRPDDRPQPVASRGAAVRDVCGDDEIPF